MHVSKDINVNEAFSVVVTNEFTNVIKLENSVKKTVFLYVL